MSAVDDTSALDATVTFTIHRPEPLAYQMAEMGGDEDAPEYHAWYADHRVTIRDGRPVADSFSLDRQGFVLLKRPTAVPDFYDADHFAAIYDPEIEALVKQQTGAAEVVVFDHTVRVQSDDKRREKKVRETVKLAHNDYTENSGPQRVRDILGDAAEAERRLGKRYAFFNLWRPMVPPFRWPTWSWLWPSKWSSPGCASASSRATMALARFTPAACAAAERACSPIGRPR